MNRKLFLAAIGSLLVLGASMAALPASAALIINGNFNDPTSPTSNDPFTGPGAYPGSMASAGAWNNDLLLTYMATPANGSQYTYGGVGYVSGPLVDSTGTPTAVTFSDYYRTPGNYAGAATLPLFNGYIYDAGTSPLELLNVPAGTYDLYLYSQAGPGGSSYPTTFAAGAAVGTAANGGNQTDYIAGTNYVKLANVSPDITGTIAFSMTDPTNTYSVFNAFQLVSVAVPEPSTFVLAGIGLVAAAVVARRRK